MHRFVPICIGFLIFFVCISFVSKPFGLRIRHGGHFIPDGKMFEKYIGGEMSEASGFDPDRFGYFDLVDELNKLGFDSWSRLTFMKPWSVTQVDIKGDAEVMQMVSLLSMVRTQICDVFVVGGKKGGLDEIVADKSVGGGEGVAETMGCEVVKHRVVEVESVKKSKIESVSKSKSITKSKKETTLKNGKLKNVESQKNVEKSVEKSVKKSLFQSSQKSVVESVGKNVRDCVGKSVGVGKSAGKDVGVDKSPQVVKSSSVPVGSNRDARPSVSVGMGERASVGMGDRPDESVGDRPDVSMEIGLMRVWEIGLMRV